MGMLVDGVWRIDEEVSAMQNARGEYERVAAKIRGTISEDGPHAPAAGRYHIFGAHNCPWSHRAFIVRNLVDLQDVVSASIANLRRNDQGWWYAEGLDDLEPVDGQLPLHRVYSTSDPSYTGRATLPVLYDRQRREIVSNESADIIRMLDGPMAALGNGGAGLTPAAQREEIDAFGARIYAKVNNGTYRCGFAASQQAYDEAFEALFATLDELDARLADRRYLMGERISELDVRLFPTLVRFDPVYYSHFKCNRRRIADYPHLSGYLRDLYDIPAFRQTVHVDLYKRGYYGRSERLNPSGVIPLGPQLDWDAPHGRG